MKLWNRQFRQSARLLGLVVGTILLSIGLVWSCKAILVAYHQHHYQRDLAIMNSPGSGPIKSPTIEEFDWHRDSLVRLGALHEKTIYLTVLQVSSPERSAFLRGASAFRGAVARRPNMAYWESPEEPPSRITVWGTKAEVEQWEDYVKAYEAKLSQQ